MITVGSYLVFLPIYQFMYFYLFIDFPFIIFYLFLFILCYEIVYLDQLKPLFISVHEKYTVISNISIAIITS